MEVLLVSLLNGLSWGLLLFLLASGLTLVLGLLGVLNFAHAAFTMLGAYLGWQIAQWCAQWGAQPGVTGAAPWSGFWLALVLAPLLTGLAGMVVQRLLLARLRGRGHASELLLTFALSWVVIEGVQLVWGRAPLEMPLPAELRANLFTLYGLGFPVWRGVVMGVALGVFGLAALVLWRARLGLVLRAALQRPAMVEALGHDLPRLQTLVFAAGSALAGLAGVLGGLALVIEPGMAEHLGSIAFVAVVLGGLGSLSGAFVACLAIGLLQTLAVAFDTPLAGELSLARAAPLLPYLALVAVLLVRPRGLFGLADPARVR